MDLKTLGISPKAVLAFLFPLLAASAATATSWIVSGNFDATEIKTAAGGVIASSVAALGAYIGKPGKVVQVAPPPVVSVADTLGVSASTNGDMPEAAAPFDPDGNDAATTDITDWPLEAFVADPKDRKGADDVPVTA